MTASTVTTSLEGTTSYTGHPRYEGANISTFIGFKSFMLLAEDAVLQHFRERGFGPQKLFTDYGLGLTIVSSSARLVETMHTDDVIGGTVTAGPPRPGTSAVPFAVRLTANHGGADVPVLTGKLLVSLVTERDGTAVLPVPGELAPFVVPRIGDGTGTALPAADDAAAREALAASSGNDFRWKWPIPYYACHYYTRIQHSAYVKLLEEAVDRYLEHVGLPITGLLAQRDWIPVVSRARADLHADAYMGEVLQITFTVDDIIKDTLFTARMNCHVQRGGELVHVASATIMHGYVLARGAGAFSDLVTLDAATQQALLRRAA